MKKIQGKNDGNEALEKGTTRQLDLDSNELIEVDEETFLTLCGKGLRKRRAERGSQEHGTGSNLFDANKTKCHDKTRKKYYLSIG